MIALPFIILLSYMYSTLFFSKDFAFGVFILSGTVGICLAIVLDKTRLRKGDQSLIALIAMLLFSVAVSKHNFYGIPSLSTWRSFQESFSQIQLDIHSRTIEPFLMGANLIVISYLISIASFFHERAAKESQGAFRGLTDLFTLFIIVIALGHDKISSTLFYISSATLVITAVILESRPNIRSEIDKVLRVLDNGFTIPKITKGKESHYLKTVGWYLSILILCLGSVMLPAYFLSIKGTFAKFGVGGLLGTTNGKVSVSNNVSMDSIYSDLSGNNVALFNVVSNDPSYWTLTTLDNFNGTSWSSSTNLNRLPGLWDSSKAKNVITIDQQFNILNLGGSELPLANGAISFQSHARGRMTFNGGHLSYDSSSVPSGFKYSAQSVVSEFQPSYSTPILGVNSDQLKPYLQLPQLPQGIINIAKKIVGKTSSLFEKANLIEQYFENNGFKYSLVSANESSNSLLSFLTITKTGFCQQYATAFAVLARVVGIPTRVAIGFDTGQSVGSNAYSISTHDVHSWPEVYGGASFGWISFEPTPAGGGNNATQSSGNVAPIQSTPSSVITGSTLPPKSTSTTNSSSTSNSSSSSRASNFVPSTLPDGKGTVGSSGTKGFQLTNKLLYLVGAVFAVIGFLFILRRRKSTKILDLESFVATKNKSKGSQNPIRAVLVSWQKLKDSLRGLKISQTSSETAFEFADRVSRLLNLDPTNYEDLNRLASLVSKEIFSKFDSSELEVVQANDLSSRLCEKIAQISLESTV